MKVLVVGSGGREHTIVWKLAQSKHAPELYAAPGNAGIAQLAKTVDIKATDIEGMVAFAKNEKMDLVVVAPDDPLVLGMVDAMEAAGIRAFGPRANAAIIEGSKVFSKNLMQKYGIPTAGYAVFDNSAAAVAHLKAQNRYPAVIKAEGLALGKGVIIARDEAEAVEAVTDMMDNGRFGASGSRVVIEDFLQGPEVSVLCFCDGDTIVPMVSAQDHKRAYDHDEGPNTGGMGTFSPSRIYTPELAEVCMRTIFRPTVDAMKAEGRPFKGVLYFGLMIVQGSPYVIEYNARFGDPETQVILPRLKSDLLDIFEAVIDGTLANVPVEFDDGAAVCVVLASGGYPVSYKKGYAISGIEAAEEAGALVIHAGTAAGENGGFVTSGGRVLGVVATGKDLDAAIAESYRFADMIDFTAKHCRRDIGIK